MLHVHTHDDHCAFGDVDFTDAELDAARTAGALARGSVSVPFADLGVLKVRADWTGAGRTHAGTWVSVFNDETGPYPIGPEGMRRGATLVPPQAFEPGPQWERYFGLGASGLTADARQYLADPGRLTWGFELETQASAGHRQGSTVPQALTPDEWVDAVFADPHDSTALQEWQRVLNEASPDMRRGRATMEDVLGRYRDRLKAWVQARGVPQVQARQWLQRQLDSARTLLDVGTDGSVRGFEIRTLGGLSPEQFAEATAKVFQVRHTVDTKCSFHIHCGLGTARAGYSEAFHSSLLTYLACHVADMPDSVRERLADEDQRGQYYAPVLTQEKMTAVRFHPSGTWEFRLFGNVSSPEDGLQCRAIAEAAMVYALKVAAGEATPLLTGTKPDLQRQWRAAFDSGRSPLTTAASA